MIKNTVRKCVSLCDPAVVKQMENKILPLQGDDKIKYHKNELLKFVQSAVRIGPLE